MRKLGVLCALCIAEASAVKITRTPERLQKNLCVSLWILRESLCNQELGKSVR